MEKPLGTLFSFSVQSNDSWPFVAIVYQHLRRGGKLGQLSEPTLIKATHEGPVICLVVHLVY